MSSLANSHELAPGTRVRDYTIHSVLGTGGFAIVYKAIDNSLGREVAIKEYFPTSFAARAADHTIQAHSKHAETFRKGIDSFLNEAKLLAQFDHPALVRVYRYWEENGTAYLAMQIYRGETLREQVKAGRFAVNEASMRAAFEPICDTLEMLHAAKCYHRDVAPDNILIGENQVPVLLDFGAARKTIEETQVFTAILKPGYAPIEQYGDAELKQGPWTDIYALAGVMHFVLSGQAPPTAVNRMLKDSMPRPSEAFVSKMPARFLQAMETALSVSPESRPQTIAAFKTLLGWDAPLITTFQPTALLTAPAEVAAASAPALAELSKPSKTLGYKEENFLLAAKENHPLPQIKKDFSTESLSAVEAPSPSPSPLPLSSPTRASAAAPPQAARPAWLLLAAAGAVLVVAGGAWFVSRGAPSAANAASAPAVQVKEAAPQPPQPIQQTVSPSPSVPPPVEPPVEPRGAAPPAPAKEAAVDVRKPAQTPSISVQGKATTTSAGPATRTEPRSAGKRAGVATEAHDGEEAEAAEAAEAKSEAATTSKRGRSSRCAALVEAFGLGTTLSADDQRFLQGNCR